MTTSQDSLRNCGFLLKEVTRLYVERFEHLAKRVSLNMPQCKALVRLEKNEGVSQARLAELAEVEPMTMVRLLDRMEAEGLLERRPDPADRRARCLYLTAKARPLLDQIWQIAEVARNDMFSGISRQERDAFMQTLERMHANLVALESGSESGEVARTVRSK